ncbi:hypothetical protein PVAND_010068 [Polypedilum vanderplanki]|uniref:Rab proteins geranylgeranyltransferase component A n=1 Tax=Polypedilum vanderplanki TaxID=319348 RepID=A0A9J6CFK7_POLVA|nr:hypothetical protein PVAND_010068 [Polypedilum vanderplanki]
MDDLPKEFDLIVIGTGFQESVIAAATSRVGKTVLHIDQNEFYGGFWASFNLENFMTHLNRDTGDKKCKIRNVSQEWFEFTEEKSEINGWNKEKIISEGRRFNIDLIPKLNYCNGKLVELLISSNICRYTEFRAVDKVLTVLNGKIDVVPGSRADIFTKKNVSIIEKRLLMKFITQCVEYKREENNESFKEESFDFPDDGKFIDLMKQQKLTDNLIHYILYAMCMANTETTFKEGLEAIRTYLTSIGRYGNTPYLFPMFGCGEIPQCFCRLCAVFGGVYWLGQKINDIQLINDESGNELVKMNFGNEEISAKKLVCGLDSNFIDLNQNPFEYISRAVIITSSPLGGSTVNSDMDGGGVVLLYYPVEGKSDGITMIQLAHYTSCISKGLYLIHLSTTCQNGAKSDLQPFVETFLRHDHDAETEDDTKPTILFSTYFEIPSSIKGHDYVSQQNGPIYSCSGAFSELDYDESIRQSRLLYSKMYPNDEFLPKAPEPEEIIIGDDDDDREGNVNLGVLADLVPENKEDTDKVLEKEDMNKTQ